MRRLPGLLGLLLLLLAASAPAPAPAWQIHGVGCTGGAVAHNQLVELNGGTGVMGSATRYMGVAGFSATESLASLPSGLCGRAQNLYAASGSGTGSFTYTLFLNGSPTSLSCGPTATSCADTNPAHAVTIAATDSFSVQIVGTVANNNTVKAAFMIK